MTMISAERGAWFARIQADGSEGDDDGWAEEIGIVHTPVIAWDDEGYALVVNEDAGRLARAVSVDGFVTICDAVEKAELEMSPDELAERAREEKVRREKRR
ncbi:hypothetical protein [Streptomyces sp. NPDC127039]|uniref:hypothetical protein n=1 Tax=Streptomyces sp. NPDC127039 TaxID=3347115 RepID=UPI0036640AA5